MSSRASEALTDFSREAFFCAVLRLHVSYIHSGESMPFLFLSRASRLRISSIRSLAHSSFSWSSLSCFFVRGFGRCAPGVRLPSYMGLGIIGIIFSWQASLSNLLSLKYSPKCEEEYLCIQEETPVFYIEEVEFYLSVKCVCIATVHLSHTRDTWFYGEDLSLFLGVL